MQNLLKTIWLPWVNVKCTYLVCFLIASSLRLFLIVNTPVNDNFIDTAINRDMGQLIINGINPYNFNDKPELRNQIRTDANNYNSYLCANQEKWNFYASSNLPLNVLFLGGVEYLFPSYKGHRSVIAFFDSILSVFILAFVLKWYIISPFFGRYKTNIIQKYLPLLLGVFLGAMSPLLLLWGTIYTETKGIELLLILSAIYYSDSLDKRLSLFLSPILLGFSVSFMALGIFIAPLCLYNVYKNNANSISKTINYCLISMGVCALWLIPFMPELMTMMTGRIGSATTLQPAHGSMWIVVYKIFPIAWIGIKKIFISFFIATIAFGVYRKRLNVAIVSGSVLYLFTNVYLMNGSMDRMNIALVTVIIILGYCRFFYFASLFSLLYLLYGSFILCYFFLRHTFIEDRDGLFVFIFTGFYFIFLIMQTFSKKTFVFSKI